MTEKQSNWERSPVDNTSKHDAYRTTRLSDFRSEVTHVTAVESHLGGALLKWDLSQLKSLK